MEPLSWSGVGGYRPGADIAGFDALVTFSGGLGPLVVLGSTLLDAPCFMPAASAASDPAPPSPFWVPQ